MIGACLRLLRAAAEETGPDPHPGKGESSLPALELFTAGRVPEARRGVMGPPRDSGGRPGQRRGREYVVMRWVPVVCSIPELLGASVRGLIRLFSETQTLVQKSVLTLVRDEALLLLGAV